MRQTRENLQLSGATNPLFSNNDDNISMFSWSCSSNFCCEAANEVIIDERTSEIKTTDFQEGLVRTHRSPKKKRS